MSDKRISELVELTSLAADDELVVVDADANGTKRVTYDTLATEVRTESEPLTGTTGTFSGDITSNGETVYHRGNVVGTVSESGGDPTGAVIERGSNANGEYTKFADGTMIATREFDYLTESQSVSNIYGTGSGTLYTRAGGRDYSFAAPFSEPPVVSAFVRNFGDYPASHHGRNIGTGSFNIVAFSSATNLSIPMSYIAIGRWY